LGRDREARVAGGDRIRSGRSKCAGQIRLVLRKSVT
jgi:hypothetical protein